MKSIRELLSNLVNQESESTYKTLAKVILSDYDQGIFKNQTDLAKECYVSESVITKFAKSLKFSGWKEFHYSLKNEHNKYYHNADVTINKSNFLFDELKKFEYYISSESNFCESMIDAINKKRKCIIIPSYQLEDSCEFLYECLLEKNIDAFFLKNRSLFPIILKWNLSEFVILIALSGQDNNFLVEHLGQFKQDVLKNCCFVISSSSQEHKVSDLCKKLILFSYSIYSSYKLRRLFLEYLFIKITFELKTF